MSKRVPDLRAEEITLEHCYVLINEFGKVMDQIEGTINAFQGLANDLDPELLKEYYESQFEPEAFQRLFVTEMGKGVLIGSFAERLMAEIGDDLEALDGE